MSRPLEENLCDTCKYKHAVQTPIDDYENWECQYLHALCVQVTSCDMQQENTVNNTQNFRVSVDLTRRVTFDIEAKDQFEAKSAARQFIDTLDLYDKKEIVSVNILGKSDLDC